MRVRGILEAVALAVMIAAGPVLATADTAWRGIMSTQDAEPDEFPELKARGLNVLLVEPGRQQRRDDGRPGWEDYYEAAVAHELQIIPLIWDPSKGQSIWNWNDENEEWELSIERYPDSVGAQFIGFLKQNPSYIPYTFALYAFHEPFNPGPGAVPIDRLRAFYAQVKTEEFPDGNMKILGEQTGQREGCESGCVDFDGITVFPFAECDGGPNYRPQFVGRRDDGRIVVFHEECTDDKEYAIQKALEKIDFATDLVEENGGEDATLLLVAIQTHTNGNIPDLWSRMPSASEMAEWVERIVLPRKTRIAGLEWYPWGPISSSYTQWLAQNRMDDFGEDRWQVVSDAVSLLSPDADGDGIEDEFDACPSYANAMPLVDTSGDDIPDDCQCGDGTGDGLLTGIDARRLQQCAAEIRNDCDPDIADATGDGLVTGLDARRAQQAAAEIRPSWSLTCPRRPEGTEPPALDEACALVGVSCEL